MSDEHCNRIEALGFMCERWDIDGPFRWVTGPQNHGCVCYFRQPNNRGMFGFVTEDGRVVLRNSGRCFSVGEFEERMRDDKPF